MRLNGWQRGGIVFSIIWATGAAAWQCSADINRAESMSVWAYHLCREAQEVRAQADACVSESESAYQHGLVGSWRDAAILPFLPIFTFWTALFLVAGIIRCIKAGFTG
jgi:hypothetical protein